MSMLQYSAYFFFVVGFALVLTFPILAVLKRKKTNETQSKEVFLLNTFLPYMIGLACLAFAFWASLSHVSDAPDYFWQILITITAVGGIALSVVTAYQSTVLIRWRSD